MGNNRSPVLQMRMTSWGIFYAAITTWISARSGQPSEGCFRRGRALLWPQNRPTAAGDTHPTPPDALVVPQRLRRHISPDPRSVGHGAATGSDVARVLRQPRHPVPDGSGGREDLGAPRHRTGGLRQDHVRGLLV